MASLSIQLIAEGWSTGRGDLAGGTTWTHPTGSRIHRDVHGAIDITSPDGSVALLRGRLATPDAVVALLTAAGIPTSDRLREAS
jgi:hypothetical protein